MPSEDSTHSDSRTTADIMASQQRMVQRAVAEWRGQLDGRVAVVTGGARGIGRCMCEGLLRSGARVVALDKSWDDADDFRKELDAAQGLAVAVDITDDAALDTAYEQVMQRYGTTDVLINNAALVSETQFYPMGHRNTLDTTDEDWATTFNINVFGTLKVIRRFIEPMREQKRGSIVNVVSNGSLHVSSGGAYYGLRPWAAEMPYQASKAAVIALTFYLGEEIRNEGVAVNAYMPQHTRASWFDTTARAYSEAGAVYFMRPTVPEHVLPVTLFLAAQDGRGPSGRLYDVMEWNFDDGYGDLAAWRDHELPPDMEETYSRLEAAMPKYERSGVSVLPFDALAALYTAGLTNLAAAEEGGQQPDWMTACSGSLRRAFA